METPRGVISAIHPGQWATSIYSKDAYFHIPNLKSARKFLRFTFNSKFTRKLNGHFTSNEARLHSFQGEVRYNSVSWFYFPGISVPYRSGYCPSSFGQVSPSQDSSRGTYSGSECPSTLVSQVPWVHQHSGRCYSSWEASHQTSTVILLLQWSPISQNWDFPLLLDQSVRQASLWWTQEDNGLWSQEERSLLFNILEMKAVLLAVSAFLPQLRDHEICLATDNSTVVAYINNQGGTKSQTLCSLARSLICFVRRTTFSF